jgi:hypothetical protein
LYFLDVDCALLILCLFEPLRQCLFENWICTDLLTANGNVAKFVTDIAVDHQRWVVPLFALSLNNLGWVKRLGVFLCDRHEVVALEKHDVHKVQTSCRRTPWLVGEKCNFAKERPRRQDFQWCVGLCMEDVNFPGRYKEHVIRYLPLVDD